MGRPMPPIDEVASRFEYQPWSGHLIWKVGRRKGERAGSPVFNKGRRTIHWKRGWQLNEARLCYFMGTGVDPGDLVVDHKNNDPADNRLANLQLMIHGDNVRKWWHQDRKAS